MVSWMPGVLIFREISHNDRRAFVDPELRCVSQRRNFFLYICEREVLGQVYQRLLLADERDSVVEISNSAGTTRIEEEWSYSRGRISTFKYCKDSDGVNTDTQLFLYAKF